MSEFPELTPPPDRRLDATARDRILARATHARGRGWLVPLVAAAAAAAMVIGVAGWLSRPGPRHDVPAALPASSGTVAPSSAPGSTGVSVPPGRSLATCSPGTASAMPRIAGPTTAPLAGDLVSPGATPPVPMPSVVPGGGDLARYLCLVRRGLEQARCPPQARHAPGVGAPPYRRALCGLPQRHR